MAVSKLRNKIVGVTVDLTREEVYAIVNTAERLGDLIGALRKGIDVSGRNLKDSFVNDDQGAEELEVFFSMSSSVAMMITAELRESRNGTTATQP